ncbi:hypothetical protein GUH81_12430 [Xanthomonas citri pv. citri]|nr:hypothetical protein [Xanthomonas citri pv. citri]MBD1507756.1 hypothetical protein [Xanthomonas citri pv. citri]MBD1518731.1 hypothetical protein [Xanthomonas citri pv. citri]MBD1526745.1 hypothetical protein [Xanthomonas citri pv. citri]MBD1560727.1 hypothetical protein [Xanthomonas citri pv. citri]
MAAIYIAHDLIASDLFAVPARRFSVGTFDLDWHCDLAVALQEQRWGGDAIAARDMAAARIAIAGYARQRPRRLIGSTKELERRTSNDADYRRQRC